MKLFFLKQLRGRIPIEADFCNTGRTSCPGNLAFYILLHLCLTIFLAETIFDDERVQTNIRICSVTKKILLKAYTDIFYRLLSQLFSRMRYLISKNYRKTILSAKKFVRQNIEDFFTFGRRTFVSTKFFLFLQFSFSFSFMNMGVVGGGWWVSRC